MAVSLHGLFLWIAACPNEAGRAQTNLTIASLLFDIWLLLPRAPAWAFVCLGSKGQRLTEYWFPPIILRQVNMAQPHDSGSPGQLGMLFSEAFVPRSVCDLRCPVSHCCFLCRPLRSLLPFSLTWLRPLNPIHNKNPWRRINFYNFNNALLL